MAKHELQFNVNVKANSALVFPMAKIIFFVDYEPSDQKISIFF